jgi:hypothetical protein
VTVTPTTETVLSTVLEAMATCLCAQIIADGSPEPCACGVFAGAQVPTDVGMCDDSDGLAYVLLGTTYPSTVVGVADLTPGNCDKGLGFDLKVGIYRCFPLEHDGSSPPIDVILSATRQQLKDEQSIRRALNCCDWLDRNDFVIGQYTPYGPAGGVVGGEIPISAMVI